MKIEELKSWMLVYLHTLNSEDKDELYSTQQEAALHEFNGFLQWLSEQQEEYKHMATEISRMQLRCHDLEAKAHKMREEYTIKEEELETDSEA